jgi:hypothetical protein
MMMTNIYALSGIRTHGLILHVIKAYASDRAATRTRHFRGAYCLMMGVLGPSQVSVCAMQHPRRQTYSAAQLIDSVLDKS